MAGSDAVQIDIHSLDESGASAAVVALNRPDQLNAIDGNMLEALDSAIDETCHRSGVRALLITGRGRAFSAGGDLKGYLTLQKDATRFPEFVTELHRVFGRLMTIPVPVVALVNGVTAAGGLELLLNCDLAIAAESARIGDGHLNFGQMGGGGVLTLLPRVVGRAKAAELLFSGRFLSAQEAAEWGIVNRVVPDDDLLSTGLEFCGGVAGKSPLAVANAKEVLTRLWAENGAVDAGLRYELARNVYYCLTSEDAAEGLRAFAEKRPPRYTGR